MELFLPITKKNKNKQTKNQWPLKDKIHVTLIPFSLVLLSLFKVALHDLMLAIQMHKRITNMLLLNVFLTRIFILMAKLWIMFFYFSLLLNGSLRHQDSWRILSSTPDRICHELWLWLLLFSFLTLLGKSDFLKALISHHHQPKSGGGGRGRGRGR